jgi:hypothetical protein
MNPDLLIAYAHVIGGLWLVIYAGRKRLAIGQWLGLGALILGTAGCDGIRRWLQVTDAVSGGLAYGSTR